MDNKAQGMPLNVIIIAIIVVIVAVVLIAIFYSNISKTGVEVASCSFKGGVCKTECDTATEAVIENTDCPSNQKCCIRVLNNGK